MYKNVQWTDYTGILCVLCFFLPGDPEFSFQDHQMILAPKVPHTLGKTLYLMFYNVLKRLHICLLFHVMYFIRHLVVSFEMKAVVELHYMHAFQFFIFLNFYPDKLWVCCELYYFHSITGKEKNNTVKLYNYFYSIIS